MFYNGDGDENRWVFLLVGCFNRYFKVLWKVWFVNVKFVFRCGILFLFWGWL